MWSSNGAAGWSALEVKLPLLFVPLILLTTRPISGWERIPVLGLYLTTVLVVSIISTVRFFTIPNLPYREAVPYISHIRYALNCCMAIFICVGLSRVRGENKTWNTVLHVACYCFIVWMAAILVMIRSYTGFAILAVVSLIMLLVYWRRWLLLSLWVLLFGGTALLVYHEVRSYYSMIPMATEPLLQKTASGNDYKHAQDGIIENGNYINNYFCQSELRREWNHRSSIDYDGNTASGFSVESTLVRYLNAIGQTKDSAGMAALNDNDIKAVERGVANPVYESHNFLRKMVYTLLLEREYGIHTHAVSGFTMLQRFELWRATIEVIAEHPWFGAGTGDAVDEMHKKLVANDSEISNTQMKSHNQYLLFTAMVGLVGLAIIALLFFRALPKRLSPFMMAWVVTILISCITEDTLETLIGILFCTWFMALRPTYRTRLLGPKQPDIEQNESTDTIF